MKIKDGYMVREVAGSQIVVPVGERTVDFNGIITLNETAAFLWEKLAAGAERADLLAAMLAEYDVDETTAARDIDLILQKLKDDDVLE